MIILLNINIINNNNINIIIINDSNIIINDIINV